MEKRVDNNIDELLDELKEEVLAELKKDATKGFDEYLNLDCALNREIFLGNIIDGVGLSVDTMIRFWNKKDKDIPVEDRQPIKIYIDSCGGSLTDSLTIIDSIRNSKTPVVGIAVGCTYSGGFFIFISCDKRLAYKHASFLYHEGRTETGGTAAQFANYAAFYKKQLNQLKQIVLDYTKINEDEYDAIRKDDIWYDTNEAIEKGIVDEVLEEFI